MTKHVKAHWPKYTTAAGLIYALLTPGPINTILKALFCHA